MRKLSIPLLLLALLVPMPAQALSNDDLLALVAMPLAVAAVSDLTGVPADDLASLVATMNQADVPPVQFVEVIRYVPVALVDPGFTDYVQTRANDGVRAEELVNVMAERLRTYDVEPSFDQTVVERTVWDRDEYVAPVRTRVAEVHEHPHGGPPGQVKKQLGLQTGAEVVHGSKPGHKAHESVAERVVEHPRPHKVKVDKHGEGHGHGHGNGNGHGKGHGKGKH